MKYAMDYHIVNVKAGSTDATTGAVSYSAGVNMSLYKWVDFVLKFDNIAMGPLTLTVYESTSSTTVSMLALPFVYRMQSPLGTDAIGAATTATSSGATVASTDDSTLWILSVDPSTMTDGYQYLRYGLTHGTSGALFDDGGVAILLPRYAQASPLSSS